MKLLIILCIFLLFSAAVNAQYQVDWYVIASGGGHSESENHGVDGTVGQAIVGQAESENFGIKSGFWAGGEPSGGDCVYIPGDCNHNGAALELGDVIAMISMYRGTVDPYYTCDCPPHGSVFAPEADPDGNCVALELGDVVTEIAAYRGTGTASGCEDCPGSLRIGPRGRERLPVVPSFKSKVKIGKSSVSE